ncbi:hypothetical protein [Nocardia arthritidis]|uniref:Phage head morphogenesis domain-containing protein n=1 Tax=Nocardia arthritidis TaxID=228602 RepID=A0A6G9YTM2_9NOCA|nr:hypothetical protein [Nocardia arthritidis]QIS16490.1 hypothetical protein F5544_43430 [Nocardia arthritidis]
MTPEEFQAVLTDLNTVMLGDLHSLWNEHKGLDAPEFKDLIVSTYPEVVSPHIALAGELAANWYNEAAPQLAYKATAAKLPLVEQLHASAGWAMSNTAAFDLLAGSAQRAIFSSARRTVIENSQHERGARFARYASPNACRFCQMLATRKDVYTSERAAQRAITGRRAGDKYHDHCHCIAVMVRPGHSYKPPAYVAEWTSDYKIAAGLASNESGSKNIKAVMAAYRQMDSESSPSN